MSKTHVIYLDFDGVLHADAVYWSRRLGIHMRAPGHTLFEWMPIFDLLLMPSPEVKIVLSTSWVQSKSFEFAKSQLSLSLQQKVIGATFHSRETRKFAFNNMSRGHQVLADVARRRPDAWFAVDNDDSHWPVAYRDRLVLTQDMIGISDTSVQDAIRRMLSSFSLQK